MDNVLLHRQRINEKLAHILEYPFSIIHAPIGYGKTTAMEAFVRDKSLVVVWGSLSAAEAGLDAFWSRMTIQMKKNGVDVLGDRLQKIGFPFDPLKTERVLDVFIDYEYESPVVIVLDDFQQAEDGAVFRLVKRITMEEIHNLHIVVITRDLSQLDAAMLYQRGLCFTLTEKALRFTREETARYFAIQDMDTTDEEIEKIHTLTDGWIAMIVLIMEGMRRGLPIEKNDTVEEIIEQNIYGTLDETSKDVLLGLSWLGTFTAPMASYVLRGLATSEVVRGLIQQKSLVTYNEVDKTYKIHNLLLSFLRERESTRHVDVNTLSRRIGEWHLRQGQTKAAYDFLLKSGAVDVLLAEQEKEAAPQLAPGQFGQLRQLFAALSEEQKLAYPMAVLRYTRMYAMSGEKGSTARCWDSLVKLEATIQRSSMEKGRKDNLLGEIHVLWTLLVFNDLDQIIIHSRKAQAYFAGGCSSVITRAKEFTFGSPHLLYLYHNRAGQLSSLVDTLQAQHHTITSVINDCGTGCDSVAQAEYALETGQYDQVELHAYKAIYKARTAKQIFLILCANYCLARLALVKGKRSECIALMDALKKDVLKENNPVLNTTYDLCIAYLACCMGREEMVPAWLREGEFSQGSFLFQGQSYYYVVQGKIIRQWGQPIQLDAYCETAIHRFERYNIQLGFLHNALHEAFAKARLGDGEAVSLALGHALAIGFADRLTLVFVEQGPQLAPLLEAFLHQDSTEAHAGLLQADGFRAYVEDIIQGCLAYGEDPSTEEESMSALTLRETEVLTLLQQGFKHSEIAEKLFISVTTVRYHIQNIYQKLEVNNKVLAIRKAQEMGILTDV